jgi:putative ABC transport system ATP-binding protein
MTSSASPQPIIQLEGVELSLPSAAGMVHILRGVDLAVRAGESVGVVGPSGSGKSTMVMIMAGLERASKGRVVVDGADYAAMNEDALALFRRNTIGIVFQSFHLVPAMTALENVAIPLELAGRSDAFDRARAELETVGLGHRLNHYPSQMSGGEQQRVALARAFATEPKLILADEPTGNLDGATGRQVMDLLFEVARADNTTLILITHDMGLAERCDRVLRIADGLLVADDRLRALAAQ